jgi:hypothetical protein
MKYRPCLWCKEYFWAQHTEKCCCPVHAEERRKELDRKRKAKMRARVRKIKESLA